MTHNYASGVPMTGYFEVCDMTNALFMVRVLETFFSDAFRAPKSNLKMRQIFK